MLVKFLSLSIFSLISGVISLESSALGYTLFSMKVTKSLKVIVVSCLL